MTDHEVVAELERWLKAEIDREEVHLRSIGGPTGMRNSPASALGLARNGVRSEVLAKLRTLAPQSKPKIHKRKKEN